MNSPSEKKEIKVHISFNNGEDTGPVKGEFLWAEPLGDNRARIANIPFFAESLNHQDIVSYLPGKINEIVGVVELGGHQTVDMLFADNAPVAKVLEELGGKFPSIGTEGIGGGIVVMDLPPDVDHEAIFTALNTLADDGILEAFGLRGNPQ